METDELELDTLGDSKTALFVILSDTESGNLGFHHFAVAEPAKDHLQGRGRYHRR